ncbi:hypothetical protein HDU67_008710 [Dinochytrium kinnereticum]|nr:hypothetical protein HDU67_008710 [Dinochytrium kinnereticum]
MAYEDVSLDIYYWLQRAFFFVGLAGALCVIVHHLLPKRNKFLGPSLLVNNIGKDYTIPTKPNA